MDAAAGLGRNPVSKHQIQMSRLTRDGTAEPVSRDQILRHARGQGNAIFPVQLTTSRIDNLTRLIHTLLYVMTIHTYIHSSSSFLSFISLIADGPHHYHPACGHKGSSHLSPVHALQFFYRDASSALLQLVNQWLNFIYSRSHAFRYERKNTNPTLVRIELTTSVLADVQLTYYQ